MNKNKERDYVVEYMFDTLNDSFWEEEWDSCRKGGLGEMLEEKFGLDYDERQKIWDTIDTHPFIQELHTLLNKWKISGID